MEGDGHCSLCRKAFSVFDIGGAIQGFDEDVEVKDDLLFDNFVQISQMKAFNSRLGVTSSDYLQCFST